MPSDLRQRHDILTQELPICWILSYITAIRKLPARQTKLADLTAVWTGSTVPTRKIRLTRPEPSGLLNSRLGAGGERGSPAFGTPASWPSLALARCTCLRRLSPNKGRYTRKPLFAARTGSISVIRSDHPDLVNLRAVTHAIGTTPKRTESAIGLTQVPRVRSRSVINPRRRWHAGNRRSARPLGLSVLAASRAQMERSVGRDTRVILVRSGQPGCSSLRVAGGSRRDAARIPRAGPPFGVGSPR
jgi:hypothetical protein